MQKISIDEVIPLPQYELERDAFRRRVIAHKRARRVLPLSLIHIGSLRRNKEFRACG